MSFDINKTIALIKGGLLDHEATWRSYLGENPGWKKTAFLLVGPLIIGSVVLQVIFSRLIGGVSMYAYPGANFLVALIVGLLMAAVGFAVLAGAFSFLAGQLGGKKNFDRAFAAVALALIPGYVAGIIGALIPGIGGLISLAGFVISLFFLWKIMPMTLEVPQEKRLPHFAGSLIVAIIINVIISAVVVSTVIGNPMRGNFGGAFGDAGYNSDRGDNDSGSSGMFSEMERQGRLIEAAQSDRFDPPADGRLDNDQVKQLVAVMEKTEAARERYSERMRKMAEEMENKESPSFSDLTSIYSGATGAFSASNAEMEVVKTGGGNWAEHQWVKSQLRTAVIQQGEGSNAIEHNFGLYQKYEDELSAYF